ncbi:pyroglutamyl-peptidase 1 [Culicoides brevitarsis]|uniref:pyroglutamyl-peptidase 1 n=1 Tax=Culicoides brevitarsis TaxID=469753 RepID=UPI00307C9E2E
MANIAQKATQNLIIVTGFDIFVGHEIRNASWEAVKLLPSTIKHEEVEYSIDTLKVPVSYEAVDEIIPKIWARNPKLVIHCGVSAKANSITLEACAYNFGYCRPDVNEKYLEGNFAKLEQNGKGKKMLLTTIDIDRIAKELNGVEASLNCVCRPESKFICSTDVGNYLCGYSFLKSLDYNLDRSLFIHVPEVDKPLSSETVAKGILDVIKKCLAQLLAKDL